MGAAKQNKMKSKDKSNIKSITLEVIQTDGSIRKAETPPKELLKTLQDLVGGIIQTVPMKYDPSHLVVCHEEGRLLGLPWNKIASQLTRNDIVGDCVVVKVEDFI